MLGAILLDNRELIDNLALDDFFLENHRKIFLCLKTLKVNGKPTDDLLILVDALKESGEIENAGGAAYVASIVDGLPRVQNLKHYIGILKDKASHRNCLAALHQAMEVALGTNSNEVLGELSRFVSLLPLE